MRFLSLRLGAMYGTRVEVSSFSPSKGVFAMLILTRLRGEKIAIDGNIIITIVEISGDKVRIGIDANRNIPVYREEVYNEIQRNSPKKRNSE